MYVRFCGCLDGDAAVPEEGRAVAPQVTAVSANAGTPTAEGTPVKVLVELDNPNDAPIELTVWNYSFVVDDRTAGTETLATISGDAITLPPTGALVAWRA